LSGGDLKNSVSLAAILDSNGDSSTDHVILNYNGGEQKCIADPTKTVNFQIEILCGSEDYSVISVEDANTTCNTKITVRSKNGCNVNPASALWKWM
jgi:hypothetical protein